MRKRGWYRRLAALAAKDNPITTLGGLLVLVCLCGCSTVPLPGENMGTATREAEGPAVRVVQVVDGDTIKVEVEGAVYPVRYIGIDCPELAHGSEPVEWMATEAFAHNRQLVEGRTVYLEKDVSETDRHGRLLRYVFLPDGTFVNAELVRQGYAQAVSYPPDVRYQDLFLEMQQEARAAERGLWGPTPEPMPTPGAQSTAPPVPADSGVRIIEVDKRAEFVDIRNDAEHPQNLDGWVLVSVRGGQACPLRGVLAPGETLRIWALVEDVEQGGYNCGFGSPIWSNSQSDPAELRDAAGRLVDRKAERLLHKKREGKRVSLLSIHRPAAGL